MITGYDISRVIARAYGLAQNDWDMPIDSPGARRASSVLRRIALHVMGRKEA